MTFLSVIKLSLVSCSPAELISVLSDFVKIIILYLTVKYR